MGRAVNIYVSFQCQHYPLVAGAGGWPDRAKPILFAGRGGGGGGCPIHSTVIKYILTEEWLNESIL